MESFLGASPIVWASPDYPPFLLVHGRDARAVPYQESVWMAGAEASSHPRGGPRVHKLSRYPGGPQGNGRHGGIPGRYMGTP